MNNLNPDLFNTPFSYIYIEEDVYENPNTKKLLKAFPNASCIFIKHYKDIFNRKKQNFYMQKQAPSLILAKKTEHLVYPGAAVCQNFGNKYFYYTSSVMNCIYNCEYCYLQGMYPCSFLVIFVNLEDIFLEIERQLKKHTIYLCISYDTDLLALESKLGYVKKWIAFTKQHPNLTIEIRTKSANFMAIREIEPSEQIILAWTLSPQIIIEQYEHGTPSLQARLSAIKAALSYRYLVRICFDPMLYFYNWEIHYKSLIETIAKQISFQQIYDASVGVFRISSEYLKNIRQQRVYSSIIQYPYENQQGVYHYGTTLSKQMISYLCKLLEEQGLTKEQLFLWDL